MGIYDPATREDPDFEVTTTKTIRSATHGFRFNSDTEPVQLHQSLTSLFDDSTNSSSDILFRYNLLLPYIAEVACPAKTLIDEREDHFKTQLSSNSARDRINQYCGEGQALLLYHHCLRDDPAHLHHLPSTLVPQTSYPLIAMSRSRVPNRIRNSLFHLAMLHKLRLPVFNPACPRKCW